MCVIVESFTQMIPRFMNMNNKNLFILLLFNLGSFLLHVVSSIYNDPENGHCVGPLFRDHQLFCYICIIAIAYFYFVWRGI